MLILRSILLCSLLTLFLPAAAHNGKDAFLARRAVPLAGMECAGADGVCIWAFGALHGSARTEEAELLLWEKVLPERDTVWYFPETDFCTAHYFEAWLQQGDDTLLYRLVYHYGQRVPQERSVEMMEKCRGLRRLAAGRRFRVVGIDPVCSPAFAMQFLLDSVRDDGWRFRKSLRRLLGTVDEIPDTATDSLVTDLAADYAARSDYYAAKVRDTASLGYVIRDLQRMGERREPAMVRNYRELDARYGFRSGIQIVRMGVGHILKAEQDGWRPFLLRLVEAGLYRRTEIRTVQAFLTRSRVLWSVRRDDSGVYSGCTTKGGWGVSDSWRERFRGIRHLKRNSKGEMTFYNLRGTDSPYEAAGCLDLVVCCRPFGRTERCPRGASTGDYLDAAVLICDSPASRPIEETDTSN